MNIGYEDLEKYMAATSILFGIYHNTTIGGRSKINYITGSASLSQVVDIEMDRCFMHQIVSEKRPKTELLLYVKCISGN